MGYERVVEGEERVVVVVNAGRHSWQAGEYGMWVGSTGVLQQIYSSQVGAFGGALGGGRGTGGGLRGRPGG
jgi:hypothetical protein